MLSEGVTGNIADKKIKCLIQLIELLLRSHILYIKSIFSLFGEAMGD